MPWLTVNVPHQLLCVFAKLAVRARSLCTPDHNDSVTERGVNLTRPRLDKRLLRLAKPAGQKKTSSGKDLRSRDLSVSEVSMAPLFQVCQVSRRLVSHQARLLAHVGQGRVRSHVDVA